MVLKYGKMNSFINQIRTQEKRHWQAETQRQQLARPTQSERQKDREMQQGDETESDKYKQIKTEFCKTRPSTITSRFKSGA